MNKTIDNKEIAALNSVDLPDNAVIFDVGCNYGDYTEQVELKMRSKSYTIHCFEPVGEFYDKERERFKDNFNVRLNNCALSNKEGFVSFCRIKSPNQGMEGCSSFTLRPEFIEHKWPYTITSVFSDTLDHYVALNGIEHIDWMKIDVEGAELSVLEGGVLALQNKIIDRIQFEYGTTLRDANVSMYDILDFVVPFGYSLCDFDGKNFVEMLNFVDDYSFNNYYLIRKELL